MSRSRIMNNPENIEVVLKRVEKPGRYTGGEWNAVKKNPDQVETKVVLAFPDLYEVGMSYLGQKILYDILNANPSIMAERVFAPWLDLEKELREKKIPLFSLENRIPLHRFDIVGFSLLYELNYTNVINMLDLGFIPKRTEERSSNFPLVIAGGPAVFNPEPLADFFDLFLIGDGEEAFLEIIETYRILKKIGEERRKILKELTRIKGIYVPSFYKTYRSKNTVLLGVKPKGNVPPRIKKRILYPFCEAPFPEDIIVPNTKIIFDRVAMEVARGCPQKCRFCQAANIYFPPRVKCPSSVIKGALNSLRSTGYEDISLASLSISDYPYLEGVVGSLMGELEQQKVSLSLSSLRPKGLTSGIIKNIVKVRKTGFTLVPEAGTERLRAVINKDLKNEDIWEAARNAFSEGWKQLKLYFMIGLPTEREEDLSGIVNMVKEIINIGKQILKKAPQINLSIASFIPKPHTPFQWLPMEDKTILREKHNYVLSRLKGFPSVRLKRNPIESSLLEGIFSRGDRKLSAVLLKAWSLGARFESWTDRLCFSIWEKAFNTKGIEYRSYLSGLDLTSVLPWEHIDTGINKHFLHEELNLAMQGRSSPPCTERNCEECQGCTVSRLYQDRFEEEVPVVKESCSLLGKKTDTVHRYLASYSKRGKARFLSHLDLIRIIRQSFKRAGIPVSYSQGFHPKMLISFAPALPLGMEGKEEWIEYKSPSLLSEKEFLHINRYLPSGVAFNSLRQMKRSESSLNKQITTLVYSLDLKDVRIQEASKKMDSDSRASQSYKDVQEHLDEFLKGAEAKSVEKAMVDQKEKKFYLYMKQGEPTGLKPQKIVEQLFPLDNPVFSMIREKIVFRD